MRALYALACMLFFASLIFASCSGDACAVPCVSDSDCFAGQKCLGSSCVQVKHECVVDGDCALGKVCELNACVAGAQGLTVDYAQAPTAASLFGFSIEFAGLVPFLLTCLVVVSLLSGAVVYFLGKGEDE